MSISGHWQEGYPPLKIWLNTGLLQKGATADFRSKFQGMWIWSNADGKHYYTNGSGFEVMFDVDATAATPSLRTLGTGGQQASAGDHSH